MYFYGWRQSLLFHCFRIREGYHNDLTALHGCFDMAYDAVLFGDIPGNVFKELFQQDLRLFYILAGAPFQRNNTGRRYVYPHQYGIPDHHEAVKWKEGGLK